MAELSYSDFYGRTVNQLPWRGDQRVGQFWSNSLFFIRPDIAAQIYHPEAPLAVGYSIDPFYKDENVPAFLKFCETLWDEPFIGNSQVLGAIGRAMGIREEGDPNE